jgi:hypothetical protein
MAGQYLTGWHHRSHVQSAQATQTRPRLAKRTPNAGGIARLGMLAVGLGIGATVAAVGCPPGIAFADTAADPFSWLAGLDPGDLSAAALPAASPLDLDISVDGFTLLDLGTGATATSGAGDIAIAFGAGSSATADGGFGDYALASTGATAIAGDPTAGATGNNFDFASAAGASTVSGISTVGTTAEAGFNGSFDYASAIGSATPPTEGTFASAGFNGSGDSASAVGQGATAQAGEGDTATPANFDSALVLGNVTTPTSDEADAVGGSSDAAFVVAPVGTVFSTAFAGFGFNSDLAGVFGDALHASATTANFMVDILPSL